MRSLDAGDKDGTTLALQVEAPGEVLRRESSVPVRHETGYVVAGVRIVDGIERVRIHHDASATALGVGLGDGLGLLHGDRADPRAHGYPPRCLLVLPSISDIIARKGALRHAQTMPVSKRCGLFLCPSEREDGLMDGMQDKTKPDDEGSKQTGPQDNEQDQATREQVGSKDAAGVADEDYEAALRERDARIAELEGEIAEAARTVESAEALRKEMDELRRRGDEERVGFELQLAGARNVKATWALLPDYENDIEKLKAAEPWLFGAGTAAPAQAGATGLPNAGAATDEGAQMRRWRKIAGIDDEEE